MKVKIFRKTDPEELEEAINVWVMKNDSEIDVIDIKFVADPRSDYLALIAYIP